MKKTLLIALAGMMLFAFAQCGNSEIAKTEGENKENAESTESTIKVDKPAVIELQKYDVTGSDEFVDSYNLLYEITKAFYDAKNCDDLENASMIALLAAVFNAKEYAEDQKITEEEKVRYEEINNEYEKIINQKIDELGCEDETEEAE